MLISYSVMGGMFPVMTHALTYIDPFNFTTFRYGIAGIAFALLLLFREGQNSFRLKGERWGLAWLFGTLGFAGFGFLVFLGQSLAGPGGGTYCIHYDGYYADVRASDYLGSEESTPSRQYYVFYPAVF